MTISSSKPYPPRYVLQQPHLRVSHLAHDLSACPADDPLLPPLAALDPAAPANRRLLRLHHTTLSHPLLRQPRRPLERPLPSSASKLELRTVTCTEFTVSLSTKAPQPP